MNQNNKNEKEQQTIKKFQKKQSLLIYASIGSAILFILLFVFVLIANALNLNIDNLIKILFILITCFMIFTFFSRRCPNCNHLMSQYNLFPTKCPKCDAKLK